MSFDGDAFVAGHDLEGILSMMSDGVVFEASFGKEAWGSRVVGKPALRKFLAAKRSYRKGRL